MSAPGLKRKSTLDTKRCWKEWMQLNSLKKVAVKFENEGLINESTGRGFTLAAIEKAAFRWILENKEEAREDLRQWWMRDAEILDDNGWKKFLAGIIKTLHYGQRNSKRYKKEIEKHGLKDYVV